VFGLRDRNIQSKFIAQHQTLNATTALAAVAAAEQSKINVAAVRGEVIPSTSATNQGGITGEGGESSAP